MGDYRPSAAWRAYALFAALDPDDQIQTQPIIRLDSIRFAYPSSGFRMHIADLAVMPSEKVAVIGPAGSGKTTLLNLVAGILTPESGTVLVDQESLNQLNRTARRYLRITSIGLVFQQTTLLPYLSVLDNILLPYRLSRVLELDKGVETRAEALARGMDLGDVLHRPVAELSYGDRRCVSVCRALLSRPRLILADDPTAGLGPSGRAQVLSLLLRSAEAYGATVLASVYDHDLLDHFDRTVDCSPFQVGEAA